MKIIMKRILAFMLSAMMITVIPSINAAAEEFDYSAWCVEENGVLTWNFNHTLSSSYTLVENEIYNCGKGLTLVKGVKLEKNGNAKLGKADSSSIYIKFTPEQNGVLTVEATSASTTLFVDTNIRDDLQKAYNGSEPSQLTLEAGVDYYIYNNSSTAVTITKITFTPDTTGATVWDLTNVNNRLENYTTFTTDDTYEYQGLTLTGGSSSSINKNGVKIYKNSGFVIYEPICSGTLSVKLTNSSNKTIYIDTNNSRQKTTTFANSTEGSKTVEKGQTYYIYNGDSADVYVKQLIFTPDTFTVTFDSDGGSDILSQQVIGGQKVSLPEKPTKEHYTFSKWQLNDEDYNFDTAVTDDITLKAVWEINKYTVTWKNGSDILETDENVEHDTAPSYNGTTPEKASSNTTVYIFSGWKVTDENGEATGDLITTDQLASQKVTANTTYLAQFTETTRKYKITFVDDDETTVLKAETEYEYGATVEAPNNPEKAETVDYTYSFAGWSPAVTTVSGDQTYTATYTSSARTYTVTWSVDGVETQETLAYGAALTHNAGEKTGHTFDGWYKEADFKTKLESNATVDGDITLYAKYNINTYNITLAEGLTDKATVTVTGDKITANGENAWKAEYGSAFTVTVTAKDENVLTDGSVEVSNTTKDGSTYTVGASDMVISAAFTAKQYSINKAASISNGDITLSAANGKAGDTITVSDTPADATYKLTALTVSYTDTEARNVDILSSKSFTVPSGVTGDITITPTFTRKTVNHITVTPTSTQIKQNTSGGFTAALYADDETNLTDVYKADISWSIEIANSGTQVTGTTLTPDASDKSKATLTVAAGQSKDNAITVKASYGGKEGVSTVTVTDEDVYTVNIASDLTDYISVDKNSAPENATVTIALSEMY